MASLKRNFFSLWSFGAILILVLFYYYVDHVSLHGRRILDDHFGFPRAESNNQLSRKEAVAVRKGPLKISENDFLLHNTKKCRGVRHRKAKKVVLFVIINTSKNHQARQQLRMSWAVPDIEDDVRFESVFVMGVAKTALWNDNGRVWHNEFGELSREATENRDMILVDAIEDYNNISVKLVAGLVWAKNHCHDVDYIFLLHDDVMIRRDKLIPYLYELPQANFIGGDCVFNKQPDRNPESRFYVSKEEFRESVYPPYCYGSAVIMTPDIRDILVDQANKTDYFRRDDVYLGMLLRDAGIVPEKMENVRHEVENTHYCTLRDLFMVQPVPLSRQKMLKEEHERFEDQKKKCPNEKEL